MMEKEKAYIEAYIIDEKSSEVKLNGSTIDILILVACIAKSLKNEKINSDDIKFAVNLGISSHNQDKLSNILSKMFKN